MEQCWNGRAGERKRKIPEKTRRPAASSGTIPTRENDVEGEQTNRSLPWHASTISDTEQCWNGRAGERKRKIPEKTRRPAASSGTIPTRENDVEGEQTNRSLPWHASTISDTEQCWNGRAGERKRKIPEKTRRPAASSGTIPTRENDVEGEQTNRSLPWHASTISDTEQCWNGRAGERKRKIPEKTRRPAASSGTIPTRENDVEGEQTNRSLPWHASTISDTEQCWNGRAGERKRKIPEKTRRPAASSGTIPTRENDVEGEQTNRSLPWHASTISERVRSSAGMEGLEKENGRSLRKPADQLHRPARFPHVRMMWKASRLTARYHGTLQLLVSDWLSDLGEYGAVLEWRAGERKRKIPEKTRRPTASSGTIPTRENDVEGEQTNRSLPWHASTISERVRSSAGMEGLEKENGRSLRKPADQLHRPARFPHVRMMWKASRLTARYHGTLQLLASTEQCWNGRAGERKRKIPEKTRRPAASSGTIPTRENDVEGEQTNRSLPWHASTISDTEQCWNGRAGERKRKIPEKTRRPAASSGTILNVRMMWKASRLTARYHGTLQLLASTEQCWNGRAGERKRKIPEKTRNQLHRPARFPHVRMMWKASRLTARYHGTLQLLASTEQCWNGRAGERKRKIPEKTRRQLHRPARFPHASTEQCWNGRAGERKRKIPEKTRRPAASSGTIPTRENDVEGEQTNRSLPWHASTISDMEQCWNGRAGERKRKIPEKTRRPAASSGTIPTRENDVEGEQTNRSLPWHASTISDTEQCWNGRAGERKRKIPEKTRRPAASSGTIPTRENDVEGEQTNRSLPWHASTISDTEQCWNGRAGERKRKIPEKTRRPAASSGTIPTREMMWKASRLTARYHGTLQLLASMEQCWNGRAGERKRKIPEKTRRPAASSGTIPTRENDVEGEQTNRSLPWHASTISDTEQCWNGRAGERKRKIPEKTRRPAASSGTIPTRENDVEGEQTNRSLPWHASTISDTEQCWNGRAGERKRKIPEKTRRPAASSGTIPTRENDVEGEQTNRSLPWHASTISE
ncbi:hypothetical protein PR048_029881 [Dryococelus australis]|uniref:Uncharacterized protein n=1 Tax=Dryococelus australis TaxID=614101 RepID=A0ABQ9G7E7_9NEOP|nr:hypothetical protein PR048_029881 [Dryococelus australis]